MSRKLLEFIKNMDCVRVYTERHGILSKSFLNFDKGYFESLINGESFEEGKKAGAIEELENMLKYFFELRDKNTNSPAVCMRNRIEERLLVLSRAETSQAQKKEVKKCTKTITIDEECEGCYKHITKKIQPK